jgi:hypothetical protein
MMKFKKGDHEGNLLVAVGNFIEAKGGKVAVAGGIQIQQWPEDPKLTFRVAIKCTGKRPESTVQEDKP